MYKITYCRHLNIFTFMLNLNQSPVCIKTFIHLNFTEIYKVLVSNQILNQSSQLLRAFGNFGRLKCRYNYKGRNSTIYACKEIHVNGSVSDFVEKKNGSCQKAPLRFFPFSVWHILASPFVLIVRKDKKVLFLF